jgi:hypothetical protein
MKGWKENLFISEKAKRDVFARNIFCFTEKLGKEKNIDLMTAQECATDPKSFKIHELDQTCNNIHRMAVYNPKLFELIMKEEMAKRIV